MRTTVSGANVAARTSTASNFASGRFPTRAANALGHAETFVWDVALGLPTRVADANGRVLKLRHDAMGREISRERVWDGVTETTEYAACGGSCPPVWATAGACGTAGTASADLAMKSTTSSPVSPTAVRHFDVLGRPVRAAAESFGSASVHRTADVLYDGRGLVACASAPYHTGGKRYFERRSHDVRGRLTKLERAGGGAVEVAYAADAANHRVVATVVETVAGADGGATRRRALRYDVLGDLVESVGNPGGAAAERSAARYVYDGGGLLESVTVENGRNDHATSFAYDAAGNRTSATGPDFGTRTFGHTALGQPRTATDGRGGTTTWTHDLLGRPTSRTDPGGGVARWTWDTAAVGLPARRTYDDGATPAVEYEETYVNDASARPTAVTTTVRPTATGTRTFTRTQTYDRDGRPSRTTHASGIAVDYEYNARGYVSKLRHGTAALVTYAETDAWGNPTRETYGNGVATARTFDPATGRVTGISTTRGASTFQAETYAWRSDGLLGGRTRGADREAFAYDALGRLRRATTYLDGSKAAARTLAYGYDALGNLTSKTSDVAGDADAESYTYAESASPTRLASAVLGGRATTFTHDADGQIVRYAAAGDDTFVEWDGRGGLPSRITVGASKTDAAPTARDEFRYGPAGERHHRRTAWRETAGGAARTRSAEVYRAGATERVVGDAAAAHPWVEKTRIGPVLAVRTSATSTEAAFEYVHADHLGSPAAVTNAAGAALLALAHDPYGTRRKADWTAQLPAAEARALAAGQDAGRTRAGFTGHETLDRTGFVHMNGRLYDPRLGRFLSADPVVARPWTGQGWNPYSYVENSPLSRTDPTGYCFHQSMPCARQGMPGAGGGFTPVSAALLTGNLSFEVPLHVTVRWGASASISVGAGVTLFDDGEESDTSLFGGWEAGYNRPYVTIGFGPVTPVWWSVVKGVALGQEMTHADAPMVWDMRMVVDAVDVAADVGEWILDFVILDTVETGIGTYEDFRDGDYVGGMIGVGMLLCEVGKVCKAAGKVVRLVPGAKRVERWVQGKWTRLTGRVVRPAGVPDDWIEKPAGAGRHFIDPENTHNWVRVMPGNPRSPHANSRVPYVRWQRNGRALDVNGNPVPRQSRESHIRVEDFVFDGTLFE